MPAAPLSLSPSLFSSPSFFSCFCLYYARSLSLESGCRSCSRTQQMLPRERESFDLVRASRWHIRTGGSRRESERESDREREREKVQRQPSLFSPLIPLHFRSSNDRSLSLSPSCVRVCCLCPRHSLSSHSHQMLSLVHALSTSTSAAAAAAATTILTDAPTFRSLTLTLNAHESERERERMSYFDKRTFARPFAAAALVLPNCRASLRRRDHAACCCFFRCTRHTASGAQDGMHSRERLLFSHPLSSRDHRPSKPGCETERCCRFLLSFSCRRK